MTRDIDRILDRILAIRPDVDSSQLQVTHPADDDGLWFFRVRGSDCEVQLESSSGDFPFLVEADYDEGATYTVDSLDEAISMILRLLDR